MDPLLVKSDCDERRSGAIVAHLLFFRLLTLILTDFPVVDDAAYPPSFRRDHRWQPRTDNDNPCHIHQVPRLPGPELPYILGSLYKVALTFVSLLAI